MYPGNPGFSVWLKLGSELDGTGSGLIAGYSYKTAQVIPAQRADEYTVERSQY